MTTTDLLKSDHAAQTIASWIEDGRLIPGQKMPSERALAGLLRMSHLTVRRGLRTLVDRGVIVKRPRVGNFVCQPGQPAPVRNIGLVIQKYILQGVYRHPMLPLLLDGMADALDQATHNLLPISYTHGRLAQELLPLIHARRLDGVLLHVGDRVTRDEVRQVLATGVKAVAMNEAPHVADLLPGVHASYQSTIVPTLEKLAALGHRAIRFCQYSHASGKTLHEAVLADGLQALGLGTLDACLVEIPNPDGVPDFNVLARALDERPTAIVVPDEFAASEIYRLCHRRGLRIPDDLSLVAQGNLMPGTQPVTLSAMDNGALLRQAAAHAARVLTDLIEGQDTPHHSVTYHGQVQWAESVSAPPAR